MALVSNTKSDWAVHAIVQECGIEKFFKAIVTSAAIKVRKPRPEIFTEALNALNVKPIDSVFVGDSIQADVAGAKWMGMHSIHVLRKPIGSTPTTNPDATVTSLSEARRVITSWNNGSQK
jgi:putative hydrolase of the HAD superfamily